MLSTATARFDALRHIVGVVQYWHIHTASYAEPAWIVAVVLAVVLHSYRYVITWNVCCCVWMNWDAYGTITHNSTY